ncbi:alpha/beta-hydrolase [Pilatotrama ljubarskyi]|nr:alpha/beta-hydrolase [Pilatotrama ljubarskyi]
MNGSKLSRFVDRLRRKRTVEQLATVQQEATGVVMTIETIPPIPDELVSDEMKRWSTDAGIRLDATDGIWWHRRSLNETLAQAQRSECWVGLQFHGGGYRLGTVKDPRSGFARIPRGFLEHQICSCVLSLEYTLAHTVDDGAKRSFPLQILEALCAYHHLLDALRIPAHRIVFIGDSAGAHLALALQRYLLESNVLPSPGGVILLSPWCDLSADADNVKGLLGSTPVENLSRPYFSPALHLPPPRWPPTLIYSGAQENFAPSIAKLVAQLTTGGAPVTFYQAMNILPRYAHDFLIFASVEQAWPDEVRECWARIKTWTDTLPVTPGPVEDV